MKFKVGDRVRAINKVDGVDLIGRCGTVVSDNNGFFSVRIGVEFDESFPGGHACCGKGKLGHCRYGGESEFELISREQKIVITTDGRETLARLYEDNKVVKSATAKRNPKDTFDFKVGADLAYSRLMTEEPPKYFKGKAECIEDGKNPTITKGKIYDFSENGGCGKNDVGTKIVEYPCVSVDAINDRFEKLGSSIRFLEIKE